MWRVRRPAGGPVTGTGSLRGSSFRLPYKRTTASSRLTSLRPPSPSHHPVLLLALSFVRQPSASLPSRSDPVRAFALASLSSFVRPTGRFSVPLPPIVIIHHVFSPLSHESVATHAKRPTASSFLRCFPPLHRHDVHLFLARASFCHSRSTRGDSSLLHAILSLHLSHLAKQRSCGVFPCFILLPPLPLPPRPTDCSVAVLFFLFVQFVVRSVIGPTIPTNGHATIYPTRRRGQSAGRKDEVRRRTDGRAVAPW